MGNGDLEIGRNIDILLIPTINMVGGQKNAKDEIQFVIKLLETENI